MRYNTLMKQIILASTSAQRQKILHDVGIPFIAVASDFEEDNAFPLPPKELLIRHALGKATAVTQKHPEAIVIGADELFVFDGKVLGKPKDAEEIVTTLTMLSGQTPVAINGYAIIDGKTVITGAVETKITFRNLSKAEIAAYAATGEGLGRAAAFGIQGKGALLVDKIEGDYLNIVGLPIATIALELRKLGVTFWLPV